MFVKKIRKKSLYTVFVVLILVVGAIFWLLLHKNSKQQNEPLKIIKPEVKSKTSLDENAEIIIKDLILKEVEKHKGLEVIINAGEGKILNSTDKIECKNIACTLNNNHKKVADLHANNAIIQKSTKNVFLSGATVGHAYDMTINGHDISYNYSGQMLNTDKEISYSHQFFTLVAKKSSVDLKNNKIMMSGGVRSDFFNSPGSGSACLDSSASNGNAN